MRHFLHLGDEDLERLFLRPPTDFARDAPAETLATALGATLYMPATRPALAADLVRQGSAGVVSSVICLEDSIADADLPAAHANVVAQLRAVAAGGGRSDPRVPLTFVRVRHPEQIRSVVAALGAEADLLSGFVLPKFTPGTGAGYLEALVAVRAETGLSLLAMPVLESPEVIHLETRRETLLGVRELLDAHRELVLAIRVGATDLAAAYGVRRGRDLTVYDVRLVSEALLDIVNVLGRADGTGHVISGPVWEYFPSRDRLFKPQLRESPFQEHDARRLRQELITRELDGLIREVVLDKANGLTGKTVIHPTHVAAVNALSVVTHEEFCDAGDILGAELSGGGAQASTYRNKMNEGKPHRAWARRTLQRAEVFGVAAEDVGFVDLLSASLQI
jgi:citrate lyase beta subunit